jgi:hypothetical protein
LHDGQLPQLRKLMRQLVADYDDHIAWFQTPMALPLLQELQPRLVVADCSDGLPACGPWQRQLQQREQALLQIADLVFTGGPGLHRAKCASHPNAHRIMPSVDASHFIRALDRANSHPAHREIPGPRLGFYGAIDERLDMQLIRQVAAAHPQWHIVLAGPVIGIDWTALPRAANIHYLGPQPYEALPHCLAGWDVCLLPFALNEATRFINPVETLEYMAAELPIVSTPLADIAELYSDVVYLANDGAQFIAACEKALLEPAQERLQRIRKMRRLVSSTSWEQAAQSVHALIEAAPHSSHALTARGRTAPAISA